MVSIEKCNHILKNNGYELSNNDIKILRDFLSKMASYQIEYDTKHKTMVYKQFRYNTKIFWLFWRSVLLRFLYY